MTITKVALRAFCSFNVYSYIRALLFVMSTVKGCTFSTHLVSYSLSLSLSPLLRPVRVCMERFLRDNGAFHDPLSLYGETASATR